MGLFGTRASNTNASQNTEPSKVAAKKAPSGLAKPAPQERILNDDDVTLSALQPADRPPSRLSLKGYKYSVAQDVAFVQDTLRHKLAEYNLPPGTRMGISKNTSGQIEIDARMPEDVRHKVEQDLNQAQAFKSAFDRLSVNEPTLEYMDNVTKISQAYGTRNAVFDSLISRDENFNRLQDIAHRYQSVRQTLPMEAMTFAGERRYQFSVNTRA